MLGTGKEDFIGVGVGVGIGKRGFKGSNKVQTRLTGNAGDRERECVGKERVQGVKKVQTRLTALVQRNRWGQGKRVCGCGSVWGEREKAEMLKS